MRVKLNVNISRVLGVAKQNIWNPIKIMLLISILVALGSFSLCQSNDDTSCTVGPTVCGQPTTATAPISAETDAINLAWCYAACARATLTLVRQEWNSR